MLADIYHVTTDFILGRSYNPNNRIVIDVTELSGCENQKSFYFSSYFCIYTLK